MGTSEVKCPKRSSQLPSILIQFSPSQWMTLFLSGWMAIRMLELIFDCLDGWLLLLFPLEKAWFLLQDVFQNPFSPLHFLFQVWIVILQSVLQRPCCFLPQWFLTSTLVLQPTASIVCRLIFACTQAVDNFLPVPLRKCTFCHHATQPLHPCAYPHWALGFLLRTKCFLRMQNFSLRLFNPYDSPPNLRTWSPSNLT